jgi:outer membrane immunogenic protein
MSLALFAAAALALGAVQAASAADLPRKPVYKAPPVPIATIYDWSGFYAGGHIGGAWSSEDATITGTGATAGIDPSGFLAGGQIGVNWQAGNWVLGLEGDMSWTNADGSAPLAGSTISSDHNWYATATGRLGYAWDNWLAYVKGGAAWMDADYTLAGLTVGDTRSGWTVGTGLEWGLAPNWSAKVEYSYMDFGSDRFALPATTDIDTQVHVVKVGLNYRFPWGGPVQTRY